MVVSATELSTICYAVLLAGTEMIYPMVKPNQKTHGFLPLGFQGYPCFLSCWNPELYSSPSCLSANLHPSKLAPKILMICTLTVRCYQHKWGWPMDQVVVKAARVQIWGVLSAEVRSKMQPAIWWSRESLQRRNGSRAATFQRVGEGKKTHGRTSRRKTGENGSWRKGAPEIRALPGEIRGWKPQDVFGDFFLNKEGGSRSQMVVDSESVGGLEWAAPSMCRLKPGPHVSHIQVQDKYRNREGPFSNFIALGQ